MVKLPNCTKPCSNCPFKKDTLAGWLGKERMTEILDGENFVCHKNHKLQCAGFMLIQGDRSIFNRLAKAMRLDTRLSGLEKVFDTKEECIKHHTNK